MILVGEMFDLSKIKPMILGWGDTRGATVGDWQPVFNLFRPCLSEI
jgi:hypothetical protein